MVTKPRDSQKKYEEVVGDISRAIQSGHYPADSQLPSEANLCQEYGVSRITVRKALSILASQGLLYSVPGKGRFVKGIATNEYLFQFDLSTLLVEGYDEARLIESSVIMPDADLVYNLYISPKDRVVVLKWLIYKNGIPVALDEKYLPYFPGMGLSEKSLEHLDFSDLLKDRVPLYDIRQEIEFSTLRAPQDIAERLKIDPNKLLWFFNINIYHKNGNPLGWSKVSILAEKALLSAERAS